MGKRKHKREAAQLYHSLTQFTTRSIAAGDEAAEAGEFDQHHENSPLTDDILAASPELAPLLHASATGRAELPKMKKFRFQLLHQWMLAHVPAGRVADIGGGKGLLAYLLQQSGWPATVIDPLPQALPGKYKDLTTNKQVRLAATTQTPRINQGFAPAMAQDFDLLVALHAHGCNIQLIDAAARYGCSFIILPCCIIHEPLYPPLGVHWLQCVVDYATRRGFRIEPFRLNFRGQNIGLYARSLTA